jgi:hypothetical protein
MFDAFFVREFIKKSSTLLFNINEEDHLMISISGRTDSLMVLLTSIIILQNTMLCMHSVYC